jgi:periplasmic protein CpxP/Spy
MNQRLTWLALALALVLAGVGSFASAQSGRGGGYKSGNANRVAAHLRWLGEQLNLTDEQKDKLKPILLQEGQRLRATHQDTALSSEQKLDKAKEIHGTFQPQIVAILTPEQQDKYKQLENEARARHQRRKGGDPNVAPKESAPPKN